MTRAERYKRNNRLLLNRGLSADEARTQRYLSDENMFIRHGIRVTKEIPPIQKLTSRQLKTRQRRYNNFRFAIMRGANPERAKALEGYKRKYIDYEIRYYPYKKGVPMTNAIREDRMEKWKDFSKDETYPATLYLLARQINRDEHLDLNSKYGYTVVFYMFVEKGYYDEQTLTKYLNELEVDRAVGKAIYETTVVKR